MLAVQEGGQGGPAPALQCFNVYYILYMHEVYTIYYIILSYSLNSVSCYIIIFFVKITWLRKKRFGSF